MESKVKSLPSRGRLVTYHNMIFLFVGIAIGSMISSNFKLISSVFPEISNGPSENSVTPMSKPTLVNDRDTIDVVVGIHLDGRKNQTGFMDEWEVHLKSLMIHAPLDFNLHVHIITNQKALLSIQQRLELSGLHHFQFRNKVTLTCYVVDKYEITWEEFIYNKTNKTPFQSAKNIYTTGAYYRLMADRVLPKDLVNVIYSDTDVVFNSNLNALYPYLDPKKHTQWLQIGKTGCSGFIILNLKTFGSHFWTTIDVLAQQKISFGGVHDQYLLRLVRENSPLNSTGILPDEWNIHYSDHHRDPSSIMELEIAFLHFNGMRNQLRGFWEGDYNFMCVMDLSRGCDRDSYNESLRKRFYQAWPVADYYVRIPWLWIRHMVKARVQIDKHKGHSLSFHVRYDP